MTLGELLQKARRHKRLSQEEVSRQLYVTRQTVSRWEQNKTLPNIHVIQELSTLYDIPITDLTSDESHSTSKKANKMGRINYMALLGSVMFNLFLFSGIAIILIVLSMSLWIIVGTFIVSPFILLYVNLANIQSFGWLNTILAIILFPIGLILIGYAKKLTANLINFFKTYYKFNMKTIKQ